MARRPVDSYTRHGEGAKHSITKEYRTWTKVKCRCLNKNNTGYADYGGRGIKICDRWINSYENFLEDMGRAPSDNHSIDRIDNNGNYEPGNCRWATQVEQHNNKRSTKMLELDGVIMSMKQWSIKLGYSYTCFYRHISQFKTRTLREMAEAKGYQSPILT